MSTISSLNSPFHGNRQRYIQDTHKPKHQKVLAFIWFALSEYEIIDKNNYFLIPNTIAQERAETIKLKQNYP